MPMLQPNKSKNIIFMGNNLSGPAEVIRNLGKERVMMGAVFGAGKRENNIIRAFAPGGSGFRLEKWMVP